MSRADKEPKAVMRLVHDPAAGEYTLYTGQYTKHYYNETRHKYVTYHYGTVKYHAQRAIVGASALLTALPIMLGAVVGPWYFIGLIGSGLIWCGAGFIFADDTALPWGRVFLTQKAAQDAACVAREELRTITETLKELNDESSQEDQSQA